MPPSTSASTAVWCKICVHIIVGTSECKQKRQNGTISWSQIVKIVLNSFSIG